MADALAWAWEHWDEVAGMGNPVGYLYRVAQSSARRYRRWGQRVVLPPEVWEQPNPPEPGLEVGLAKLSAPQRVAIVLVHGLGWTYEETAESMGVPITSVRNHLHRGLIKLRRHLGEHR
jgi:RNA polymerase sigma-70 factor (ECF subfamily)